MKMSMSLFGALAATILGSSAASAEVYIVNEDRPTREACFEKVYVPARVAVVGTTYWVPPPVRQWQYHEPGHTFADPVDPRTTATVARLRVVEPDHYSLRPIDCR
jgi:hypothetical protein